jgi:hypothetical protein
VSSLALPKVTLTPALAGYVAVGLVGAIALVWILNGGGRTIARSVGALPGDVAGGLVEGIGEGLGIPRTNQSQCERDLADGKLWDASFSCPAGTFIKGIFGGGEAAAPINFKADSSGVPFY